MTPTLQIILTLLVFLVSALYASVGHAGASGDIAAMGLVGVPALQMKPIALVLNLFVATIGTIRFYRAGYFSWRSLWPFLITSVPFAFIGGRITLPGTIYRPMVGLVLLYAAYRLVALARAADEQPANTRVPLLPAMAWGALIGLISGLTGVGGGIFLSPLLLLMGWAGTRQSAAVSAAFILANSIAGLAGNVAVFHTLPHMIFWLIPAAILGGLLGSELGSRRLNPTTLRRLLAVALVVAAIKMLSPR